MAMCEVSTNDNYESDIMVYKKRWFNVDVPEVVKNSSNCCTVFNFVFPPDFFPAAQIVIFIYYTF